MKRRLKYFSLSFFVLSLLFQSLPQLLQACSRVFWSENGVSPLVGRNMDWMPELQSDLWVLPRNIQRNGLTQENPLQWTSKYGSIVASAYGHATADGLNEKGLGAHLLWLSESDYGKRDPKIPGLSASLWAQYFLDNFATVQEAIESLDKKPFQIATMKIPNTQLTGTVHLALEDPSGDSAIIEYIKGKPYVYHGKQYKIMTNEPSYDKQLQNVKQYAGLGGKKYLPGSNNPADRFVRATYYLEQLHKPATLNQALAGVLAVMHNVQEVFLTNPDEKNDSPQLSMLWTSVMDLSNKVYYFQSTLGKSLVWVDLKRLNFNAGAPVLKFDVSKNLEADGNVQKIFQSSVPFEFWKADSN